MARPDFARLGPFLGGLNLASDPSAVADNELVECVNLELDVDGSLVCRPPIVETTNNSATTTDRLVMIGRAVLAGGTYVIAADSHGAYAFDGAVWSTISTAGTDNGVVKFRVAVQYQNVVYLVAAPGSHATVLGGRWDGAVFSTDANMPKGEAAVFFKSRMWIVPGIAQTGAAAHQLRFTDPIAVGTVDLSALWNAVNLIPVGQGDGQNLVDIQIVNDNLMLFKQDSTYIFAYDILPSEGLLKQINDNIGATTRKCVVSYENSVFLYHEGRIFEVINYNFQRINLKVPFALDTTTPGGATRAEQVFICLFGDRIIVRYFNTIYSYNLKTKTWAEWDSSNEVLRNFGPLEEFPATPTQSTPVVYYAGSSILTHENFFVMKDGYEALTIEETLTTAYDIECKIRTKNFDFGDSSHFKKLAWWGVDVLSVNAIQGVATPLILNIPATWGSLGLWGSLGSWGSPDPSLSITITTDVVDGNALLRKFIKFLKALRFRQINFYVKLLCDGSTAEGPCRIFWLTAIVGGKQTVVKQVS